MSQIIKVLVEAGKASAGPPLGPALGPTGVNVGQVVAEINNKTSGFLGMKVPVEVIIDPATKEFKVKTGSPPTSQLIMQELGLDKLSGNPGLEKVGNIGIESIINIAKSKIDSLNATDLKSAAKIIVGSCTSVGVLVEGMTPSDAAKAISEGMFDKEINEELTEVSEEKKAKLAAQLEDFKKTTKSALEEFKKAEEEKASEKAEKAESSEEGKTKTEGTGATEESKG